MLTEQKMESNKNIIAVFVGSDIVLFSYPITQSEHTILYDVWSIVTVTIIRTRIPRLFAAHNFIWPKCSGAKCILQKKLVLVKIFGIRRQKHHLIFRKVSFLRVFSTFFFLTILVYFVLSLSYISFYMNQC